MLGVWLLFTSSLLINASSFNTASCFAVNKVTGPPNNVFGDLAQETSTIASMNSQSCGMQYPDCFRSNGAPSLTDFVWGPTGGDSVCREVSRFTIPTTVRIPGTSIVTTPPPSLKKKPETTSNAISFKAIDEVTCPIAFGSTSTACDCQFLPSALAQARTLKLELSLTRDNCCQTCQCFGDPHCISFLGAKQSWVVCNGRDPNSCEIEPSVCTSRTWGGLGCNYRLESISTGAACEPNKTIPAPTMLMYSKQYLDTQTGKNSMLKVYNVLGNMGNIVCVNILMGPADSTLVSRMVCVPSENAVGTVPLGVANLRRGVQVAKTLTNAIERSSNVAIKIIIMNPGGVAERLELTINDMDRTRGQVRGGFCHTGVIEELAQDAPHSDCVPSEAFIYKRLCWAEKLQNKVACAQSGDNEIARAAGKTLWCQTNFATQSDIEACISMPWYQGICQRTCMGDDSCFAACLVKIKEVPNEVLTEMPKGKPVTGTTLTPTTAPTVPPTACPKDVPPHPFPLGGGTPYGPFGDPDPSSYLFLQPMDTTNPLGWGKPLMWWSAEQLACGMTHNIESTMPRFGNLLTRGATYRYVQCQTFDETCGNKLKDLSVKTTYNNGDAEGASQNSRTLRQMYDTGMMVCNAQLFPNCPADYKCCMWPKSALRGWQLCMAENHPTFVNNPNKPCVQAD